MSDLYQEIIIEEYQHPHNFGVMSEADVTQRDRNSSCGDEITIYLKFDHSKKHIEKMVWTGSGCAISQATAGLLSIEAIGKTLDQILSMSKHDLEELLGLDEIVYGREKCLLLSLEAVQKSLRTYQKTL